MWALSDSETNTAFPACAIGAAVPVRVLLVAPYAPRGGGMGRVMAYLADTADREFAFETVESGGARGLGPGVWQWLRAAGTIWCAAAGPDSVILHVNMAEGGSILRKGLLLLLGNALGLHTILHLHAAEIVPFYARQAAPVRAWIRAVFRSADGCIVLGQEWRGWLRDSVGVEARRIDVLRNGVPAPHVSALRPCASPLTIVFLGNLLPRKGLPDLLAALADPALRDLDWELVVAGSGCAAPVQAAARRLGLERRVRCTGWLDRAACTALLANAAMLVLPAYHEGLPLVLLEAASLGVPAITTPVGAIAEVFTDGDTALLVPPGDIAALAGAIGRMLRDAALRTRIGRNARALFRQSLSIQAMRRDLADIYGRRCRGRRGLVGR
jgi:glycosyltransferase involved in cell wall biosynthesis